MSHDRSTPSACSTAVPTDVGDPALPVAGAGSLAGVRRSRSGRWRAVVLIAVHLVIAAHITHFMLAGRTLSPVEPSEAMYTLELGQLNAGFIFFAATIVLTMIFGRFFCGWACHIVALQDLCGWAMRKLGIRPRPFRSRMLALAPLLLALYMFVWPSVKRMLMGTPELHPLSNHLMTDDFWATFPGPLFAILTFVTCGFAAVWFLGNKGFCAYGCPYGAFFGAVDKLAPGRIRVTDACEQCGHCTATCTSNVLVHEEVRRFGMVVDPGCMKCMDCVSVCPKNALYFGFGRPAVGIVKATKRIVRRGLGWGRELLIGGLALAGTLAFRGLYDGPPLLMSVGLGGLTAYAGLTLWRLRHDARVTLQNLTLKRDGRVQNAGRAFQALALVWIVFTMHSGWMQWERAWGNYHLNRTQATREEVLSGAAREKSYPAEHGRAAAKAEAHLARADRWGLAGVVEIKLGLAWFDLLRDDVPGALARVSEAISLAPSTPRLHDHRVDILVGRGRTAEAIQAMHAKLAVVPPSAADHFRLAGLLATTGQLEVAARHYASCLELAPDSTEARYNLGATLRRLGRHASAVEQLARAAQETPGDAEVQIEFGHALTAAGRPLEAAEAFERGLRLDPSRDDAREALGRLRPLAENGL